MSSKQIIFIGGLFLGTVMFQNCKGNLMITDAGVNNKMSTPTPSPEVKVKSTDFYQLHYFDGGWYGPYPNWKNDLTIRQMKNGKFQATSRRADPDCDIAQIEFSDFDLQKLETLLGELEIEEIHSEGPFMVDGGVHQMTLTDINETSKTFSFSDYANEFVVLIARNNEKAVTFLKELSERVPTSCATSD